jgi:glycosyltransferase involved in cell wall biosynthesis
MPYTPEDVKERLKKEVSIQRLAEALLRLANDAALRETFSGRVREMQYGDRTWQSIAVQTRKVYEDVLRRAVPESASGR